MNTIQNYDIRTSGQFTETPLGTTRVDPFGDDNHDGSKQILSDHYLFSRIIIYFPLANMSTLFNSVRNCFNIRSLEQSDIVVCVYL